MLIALELVYPRWFFLLSLFGFLSKLLDVVEQLKVVLVGQLIFVSLD